MAEFESTGPLLTATIWPITFIAGVFLGLRIFVKLQGGARLWWDDYILIFSWLCLLPLVSLVQATISMGFGMHITDIIATQPQNMIPIALYGQITLSIALLAINSSKISFAVTLLRLTKGWWRRCLWLAIGSLLLLMIPALILPWVLCTPLRKSFDDTIPGYCSPKSIAVNYGLFEAAWAATMDFAFALFPWHIIRNLQMLRTEKIGVAVAMSLGVLAGIIAIIKGIFIVQLADEDFSFSGKYVIIFGTAEPAAAIIAASIPVLRVFIRANVPSRRHGSSKKTGTSTSKNDLRMSRITIKAKSISGLHDLQRGSATRVTAKVDDGSDKSILNEEENMAGEHGWNTVASRIAQTSTCSIEYPDDMEGEGIHPVSESFIIKFDEGHLDNV